MLENETVQYYACHEDEPGLLITQNIDFFSRLHLFFSLVLAFSTTTRVAESLQLYILMCAPLSALCG